MIRFKPLHMALFFCLFAQTLKATTYYVATNGTDNPGGGTAASPWRSIRYACQQVPADQGHVIRVGAGSFVETATCPFPSGTTLEGAGRAATVISANTYPIIQMSNASNVVMRSFTLDGRNKALWQAIQINGITGFEFYDFKIQEFGYWTNVEPYVYLATVQIHNSRNVRIHDFEGVNASQGHNAMIEFKTDATDVEVFNGVVNNSEASHGKVVAGGPSGGGGYTTLTNVRVHDNIFHTASVGQWEIPGTGIFPPQIVIEFWNVILDHCEIYNNEFNANVSIQSNGYEYPAGPNAVTLRVHHNRWLNDRATGYQYGIETSNDNNEIDHNYFYGGAYALASFGEWGAKPLKRVKIHHNVFENQDISTLLVNFTGNVEGIEFCNNTVRLNSGNNLISVGGSIIGFNVRDNIFYQSAAWSDGLNVGANIAYNQFFNMSPKGANALSSDPAFAAGGAKPAPYFELNAGSPAIDSAQIVTGINDSYLGAGPDRGAFERGSTWTTGPGAGGTPTPTATFTATPTPYPIAGRIEAEDYKSGPDGTAYHDLSVANEGGAYRNDGVDIEASSDVGGGYNLGWTKAGEWTAYSVNVAQTGNYVLTARVASGGAGGTFHVTVGGLDVSGPLVIPDSGGWQTWRDVTRTVSLLAGVQEMRLVMDSVQATGSVGNINYVEFTAAPLATPTRTASPTLTGTTTPAPAYGGFYVSGRFLFSPCGEKVILRGVNEMSTWDGADPTGAGYLAEISKTGANVVRLTFVTTDTAPKVEAVIQNCLAQGIIPLIENHSATGDLSKLPSVVQWWTQPAMVSLIQKYEKSLLVNIANESGDGAVTSAQFISAYSSALAQLRSAGIRVPLIIDPSTWGQDFGILQSSWMALRSADPLGNVMFSLHVWWNDNDATRVSTAISAAVSSGMPLLVGEFAQAAVACSGAIAYPTIIQRCTENEVDYLAWSWGSVAIGDCAAMSMTCDGKFASLGLGSSCGRGDNTWALTVVNDPSYGIKATSVRPAFMVNGFSCAPSPSPTPSSTRTPTRTVTPTATATRSVTSTCTFSSTVTGSATPSLTTTSVNTVLPSATATRTQTPLPSATATTTSTPRSSGTVTTTSTSTLGGTATQTQTALPSVTATPTSTPTLSGTATGTQTALSSPTATTTPTPTLSGTATRTQTALPSATPTTTSTARPSGTATRTQTVLPSATFTSTPTAPSIVATQTASNTVTSGATASGTSTPTQSPSATASPSVTPAGGTPSATPGSGGTAPAGPLLVLRTVPVPNPGARSLQLLLSGTAERCRVTLYSVAMQKVASLEVSGSFGPGWISVPLPSAGLAGGLYYAQVTVFTQGRQSLPGLPARVYLMP